MAKSLLRSTYFLFLLFFVACGDGDEDVTEVVRLSVDDSLIGVEEDVVVRAGISFSRDDVFRDNDEINLIVRLPQEVFFIRGTSEVQGSFDDEDIGAQIFSCPDGETVLVFELDENDLRFADNPSGDSDAEISFTIGGSAPLDAGIISAIAVDTIFFSACEDTVLFNAQTQLTVVG